MDAQLPDAFRELESFVPSWALGRYSERTKKRISSSMEDIRKFHGAMMPRLEEIIEHLNGFPLGGMPTPEQRLLELCLSLAQVGNCVTLWHAPDQQDAFAATRVETLLE